jgi:hypothetical protein
MKRTAVSLLVAFAVAFGAFQLLAATAAEAARPCPPPPFPCLDYWDPVRCFKPGEGWKVYTNRCYASADCAKRCNSVPL